MKTKHFTAANPPPSTPLVCTDESRTRQSEKDRCDVNMIMKKFQKTGILPQVNRQAFFADVSAMPSYQASLNQVNQVTHYFEQLPAQIRSGFDNDPAKFLDFVSDRGNRAALVDMGLLEKDADLEADVPGPPGHDTPEPDPPDSE